jgi:hypothetical protein
MVKRHPEHDRLVKEVRSWYLTSHPKGGYCGEQRRFGYYASREPLLSP